MTSSSKFVLAMEGIATEIQALNLTGLEDNRVAVRRLPHDGEHYFPGITVYPYDEQYRKGTNTREHIGYGCGVAMVVNNDNAQLYLLDRLLYWRECIRRYFVENHTITNIDGDDMCMIHVEHGHVIDWNLLFSKNYDVSTLVLRVFVLETRS